MRFCAIKKWKDGGEQTIEYFDTCEAALAWIKKQPGPRREEFVWCVGEY